MGQISYLYPLCYLRRGDAHEVSIPSFSLRSRCLGHGMFGLVANQIYIISTNAARQYAPDQHPPHPQTTYPPHPHSLPKSHHSRTSSSSSSSPPHWTSNPPAHNTASTSGHPQHPGTRTRIVRRCGSPWMQTALCGDGTTALFGTSRLGSWLQRMCQSRMWSGSSIWYLGCRQTRFWWYLLWIVNGWLESGVG